MRFVDFDAATDGPVVVDDNGVPRTYSTAHAGGTVSVEEIILCEACVRAAAEELAVQPRRMEEMAQKLRDAEAEAERQRARAEALRAAAVEWGADPAKPPRPARSANVRVGARTREMALAMLEQGATREQVSERFGVSVQTVGNWKRKAREKEMAHA